MSFSDIDDELTLDLPEKDPRPIHAWTPHISIDAMSERERAKLNRDIQVEIEFDDRYEDALLDVECRGERIPIQLIQPILDAIAPIRDRERDESGQTAVRELLWKMKEEPNAANRRVLLGDSGESTREAAALDGVPKSTLHRKEKAFREKWDSGTP